MLTIEGIYDGEKIKPLKEIPFKGEKRILITFLNEGFDEIDTKSVTDPIKALRGCAKSSNLTQKLIEARREDIEIEEGKWRK